MAPEGRTLKGNFQNVSGLTPSAAGPTHSASIPSITLCAGLKHPDHRAPLAVTVPLLCPSKNKLLVPPLL